MPKVGGGVGGLSVDQAGKPVLLIVEDDPGLQSQLKWSFEDCNVELAGDRETALNMVRRHEPPVVTLDLGLPPDPANASEGLKTLVEILRMAPRTKVIVVTGNDDRENAVRAVGSGAYDFYQKPIDADILRLIVDRAFALYKLEGENRLLLGRDAASPLDGILAASVEMTKACNLVEKVAGSDASVLILGESGTGKELLTRALHNLSPRRQKRFVTINCAAIPETLLESELFGYEKGAFTGATKLTIGKIEHANGGTLFLDEIGDLPQTLQAKLLRFLQERTIERLGGRQVIDVDVRVVCATHQNLAELIKDSRFREDLFYRVSEVTIPVPPLRERPGDPVLLAQVFLNRYGEQQKRSFRGFTDRALAAIESYAWPGNARELENRVKRAAIMAEGTVVDAEDLELSPGDAVPMPLNLRQVREEAERHAIKRALALSNERVAQAADMLGVSRPTLYNLIEKFSIK